MEEEDRPKDTSAPPIQDIQFGDTRLDHPMPNLCSHCWSTQNIDQGATSLPCPHWTPQVPNGGREEVPSPVIQDAQMHFADYTDPPRNETQGTPFDTEWKVTAEISEDIIYFGILEFWMLKLGFDNKNDFYYI